MLSAKYGCFCHGQTFKIILQQPLIVINLYITSICNLKLIEGPSSELHQGVKQQTQILVEKQGWHIG